MKKSIVVSFELILVLCLLFTGGCDSAKPKNKDQQRQVVDIEVLPQADVPPNPPEQAPPNAENETIDVKAEVGVGSKGSSYAKPTGGPMDFITVPISAGFRARERISFLLIDDAMNKFRAIHDRVPDSHEEFMKEIVQESRIALPQLPPNQEYSYDPSDGELKVRRPKTPQ